jgi:hypothetical protein
LVEDDQFESFLVFGYRDTQPKRFKQNCSTREFARRMVRPCDFRIYAPKSEKEGRITLHATFVLPKTTSNGGHISFLVPTKQ